MQGNMALGTATLLQATSLVETIDRRDHGFPLVIQQQRAMHQSHRTRPALALTPTLGGANHLAPVEIDVEPAIAESALDFTQGGFAPSSESRSQIGWHKRR